jgi:site-specific recombinase XerD
MTQLPPTPNQSQPNNQTINTLAGDLPANAAPVLPTPTPAPRSLNAKFRTYLQKQNLSPATLKNYVSDIDQFLEWVKHNLQENKLEARQLTQTVFSDYARALFDPAGGVHPATANRYLSSLRSFGEFLVAHNLAVTNPAAELKNKTIDPTLDQLLTEFKHELTRQKLAASTVKNYVSDVKNYLAWTQTNIQKTDSKLDLLS